MSEPNAWILCYHKVGTETEQGRRLNVHPARLTAHARFFARRGRTFVRAADLAGEWPQRAVCFTFDDAYASALDHAVPVLRSLGASATFYAVPGLVGQTSAWDGSLARPLAGWDALREAQSEGFEIGNHTLNHTRMAHASPEECATEVLIAHQRLVAEGLEPGSFCYPYGSHSEAARRAVADAGYRVGLALEKRRAEAADDRLRLPRIVVAYGDALPLLLYRMHVRPKLRRRR